jgi:hypothetical protein
MRTPVRERHLPLEAQADFERRNGITRVHHRARRRLSGTDLDFMIHTSDTSPFPFHHGNSGLHLGAGVPLNTGGSQ